MKMHDNGMMFYGEDAAKRSREYSYQQGRDGHPGYVAFFMSAVNARFDRWIPEQIAADRTKLVAIQAGTDAAKARLALAL